MPRIAVDLSIMATVAAAIAVAVWIVGAALPSPSAPVGPLTRPVTSSGDGLHGCLEAPVTSPSGIAGQGTICTDGPDVRATLQVSDLSPGEEYMAWLRYGVPALCDGSPCSPIDLPSDGPVGLMAQLDRGIAPPSRAMQLTGALHGIRLVSGGQVALLLLRRDGRAGPHAQAVFTVP